MENKGRGNDTQSVRIGNGEKRDHFANGSQRVKFDPAVLTNETAASCVIIPLILSTRLSS